MKVVDDKKTPWSATIECSDCGSMLEIIAADIQTERRGSFDEYDTYYTVKCGACGYGLDVSKNKAVPNWVKVHAKPRPL